MVVSNFRLALNDSHIQFNSHRFAWCILRDIFHLYLNEISSNKTKIYEFLKLRLYFFPLNFVCPSLLCLQHFPIQSNLYERNVFMIEETRSNVNGIRMTICYLCENLDMVSNAFTWTKWRTTIKLEQDINRTTKSMLRLCGCSLSNRFGNICFFFLSIILKWSQPIQVPCFYSVSIKTEN